MEKLHYTEIFYSLQGEGRWTGVPSVFFRTYGCNFRCKKFGRDRDEVIELLEDAVVRIPEEIRQARWMLKERQEFLEKTKREADEILGAARQQAERMVQRTEVVRAAEARARNVIDAAEEESRRLKNETEDFLDQRLGSFEILLGRLAKTVATGRERLSIGSQPQPPAEAEEPIEQQHASGFFDQDFE